MSTQTRKSLAQWSSLTIREIAELVKQLEACYGADTSVIETFTYSPDPVNLTSNNLDAPNFATAALSEFSKFDVLLEKVSSTKISHK